MISVVIPTYNRKTLLSRAVESVLAQTYKDLEIIIVDDASTDGTEDHVRMRFRDPRIRYVRLLENGGVHIARNRGLELVQGEFVHFLDSDDELFSHALAHASVVFADPSFGVVYAPFRLPSGELTGFNRKEGEMPFSDLLCEKDVRKHKTGMVVVRRTAIADIRFVQKNLDYIFYRRVAAKTRAYYLAEALGTYHLAEDALSMSSARKKSDAALSIARAKEIASFLDEFSTIFAGQCSSKYAYYAYGTAVGLLLGGEQRRARAFARAAVLSRPCWRYRLFYGLSLMPFSSVVLSVGFALKRFVQAR